MDLHELHQRVGEYEKRRKRLKAGAKGKSKGARPEGKEKGERHG